MAKKERHQFIADIIAKQEVSTQEELVELLREEGFDVTQATVSRDIRQMGLVKSENNQGVVRYHLPQQELLGEYGRLSRMLRQAFRSQKQQKEMMVISTLPGNAPAIANVIEELYTDDLFTVISNDNRLLMIGRSQTSVERVWHSLQKLMGD